MATIPKIEQQLRLALYHTLTNLEQLAADMQQGAQGLAKEDRMEMAKDVEMQRQGVLRALEVFKICANDHTGEVLEMGTVKAHGQLVGRGLVVYHPFTAKKESTTPAHWEDFDLPEDIERELFEKYRGHYIFKNWPDHAPAGTGGILTPTLLEAELKQRGILCKVELAPSGDHFIFKRLKKGAPHLGGFDL